MEKFKHYLLTRYNVGLYSSNPYNIKDPEEWMSHRLAFFELTAKTVAAQKNKNFEWLLFFDENTPEERLKEVAHILAPVVKAGVKGARLVRGQALHKPPTPWVITTRFDSDDFLAPEFIEIIQQEFNDQTEVLDVVGVQLDWATSKYYDTTRHKPNSPFISLVEKSATMRTVYAETHSTLYGGPGGRLIGPGPYYIQVIHDRNLMNKINGPQVKAPTFKALW